jgi:hypothetical protein
LDQIPDLFGRANRFDQDRFARPNTFFMPGRAMLAIGVRFARWNRFSAPNGVSAG